MFTQSLFTLTSTPMTAIATPKVVTAQRKTTSTMSVAQIRSNKGAKFAFKPQGLSQRSGVSMSALPE